MRRFVPLALLTLVAMGPLAAQVGYSPDRSPYRAIDHGTWLEVYGGQMFGSGGPIPIGPRDGSLVGLRLDVRGRSSLQLGLGGWVASAKRNVINSNDSVATRIKGPFDQRVGGVEGTFQFNVTGGKSWRGLAPYASLSVGFAFAGKNPTADSSGYAFGTKTYFAPAVGTRLMVGERLFLKGEARATFWKIKYPLAYSYEPTKDPGTVDAPNAVNPSGRSGDYALAPKLIFGIGWAF